MTTTSGLAFGLPSTRKSDEQDQRCAFTLPLTPDSTAAGDLEIRLCISNTQVRVMSWR